MNSTHSNELPYRADIDGLRAVAVSVVVLFHVGLGCPGGFVGVDVFFVISGFLITSFIQNDLQKGNFSLAHFWERRARRIVPAMFVMCLATLAAGWFLLLPEDCKDLGNSAISQSFFSANIHFWEKTGYFSGPAEEKPLLHTWSLSVEEQFYIIVPLVLAAWAKIRSNDGRVGLFPFFGVALVISFALSCYAVFKHPTLAFYLLPTRAWELLCGAVLAVAPAPLTTMNRPCKELLTLIGLGCIMLPVLFYDKNTPFPGLAAFPPCFGAVLIIASNLRQQSGRTVDSLVGKFLASGPMVFVGLISYSLYLWHWPVIAFTNYWSFRPLSVTSKFLIVLGALALATISWKIVETPFRRRQICRSSGAIFLFAGAALISLSCLGWYERHLAYSPGRISPEVLACASAKTNVAFINELSVADVKSGKFVPFGAIRASKSPDLLVWGDSHAMAILPAFDSLAKEHNVFGLAATHSGLAPLAGYTRKMHYGFTEEEQVAFSDAVLNYVGSNNIKRVVLVGIWSTYFGSDESGNKLDADESHNAQSAFLQTVTALHRYGTAVWILEDVPRHLADVPKVLAREALFRTHSEKEFADQPDVYQAREKLFEPIRARLQDAGAKFIDLGPFFLADDGKSYLMSHAGKPLYRDDHHLSVAGALFVKDGLKQVFEN